ncbi:MAG: c-type cytochrome [Verrucomicrobiota bacterium]
MRFSRWFCGLAAALAIACLLGGGGARLRAAEGSEGLLLTVASGGATDRMVRPNVQLHVAAGEPASPGVPAGPFQATWTGFIASELRAEYAFHAELAGEVQVEIQGVAALAGRGDGSAALAGAPVRLNKGTNALKVTFTSPAQGDAFLRLYWSNRETPRNPLPRAGLTHADSPELDASRRLHRGRDLWAEHRCGKCHASPGSLPELAMDAPALAGIGGRRRFDWLARWLENPAALRPGTPMPQVLGCDSARADAEAMAAYLVSLGGPSPSAAPGDVEAGKTLYATLHCAACHQPPDAAAADPKRIPQKQVKAKFTPGALAAFLQKPEEHFAWIRMPNFRLSAAEAANLAAYLESAAEAPAERSAPTEAALLEKGRKLLLGRGCLNCHALPGAKSELTARPLSELGSDRWTAGCLADPPAADGRAPRFTFSAEDRAALRAFGASDRRSLDRHTAADFLTRHAEHLNCRGCHGAVEEFPSWEVMGGKLKPEWAAEFIAGREPWKPRPWLEARMPAFPAYASGLAQGLATLHGLPARSPSEPGPEEKDAAKGRQLVSANGGFSCVSCHGVGDFQATAVFEAPGINLAHSQRRLQPEFFRRWLRSPMSVDPLTKMPVYFDEEGRSPLPEFFEGDGPKTIQAVWEYLKQGAKMARPE